MMPYDLLFIDWEVVDNIEAYFSYDKVYDNPYEIVVTSWTVGWEKPYMVPNASFFKENLCLEPLVSTRLAKVKMVIWSSSELSVYYNRLPWFSLIFQSPYAIDLCGKLKDTIRERAHTI